MAVTDPYDYLFKFLVIGSAGTGKSCLLHQVTFSVEMSFKTLNQFESLIQLLLSLSRASSRKTVHTQLGLSSAAK